MKTLLIVVITVLMSISSYVSADTFGTGANQFEIDFVTISGDTNPSSGSGIVNNDYRMGVYEITNDQWSKFEVELAVPVTGSPSAAYGENQLLPGTNVPAINVSWYEAAQFVNWLNISTGHQAAYKFTGTQGTDGYALTAWGPADTGYNPNNPFRNSDAYYFLPTRDEWTKAGYWNGTNLQRYATQGDIEPIAGVDTNYDDVIGKPWDVGSGLKELNGTYDMMGNVLEWMESPYHQGNYSPSTSRAVVGAAFDWSVGICSGCAAGIEPLVQSTSIGFRVASVPEPATLSLLAFGGLALLRKRK